MTATQRAMVTNATTERNEFDGLWTVPEAAKRLRVSESYIRKRIADGTIRAVRLGSRVLLDPADMRAWVEDQKAAA